MRLRSSEPDAIELDGQRWLRLVEYAKKYGLQRNKLAIACRANALIARNIQGGKQEGQWYILDLAPSEHPDWDDYERGRRKHLARYWHSQ